MSSFWTVFLFLLFLLVVLFLFLSIDTDHWSDTYVRVREASREPFQELSYETMDIFTGGALTLQQMMRGQQHEHES